MLDGFSLLVLLRTALLSEKDSEAFGRCGLVYLRKQISHGRNA